MKITWKNPQYTGNPSQGCRVASFVGYARLLEHLGYQVGLRAGEEIERIDVTEHGLDVTIGRVKTKKKNSG